MVIIIMSGKSLVTEHFTCVIQKSQFLHENARISATISPKQDHFRESPINYGNPGVYSAYVLTSWYP